MFQLVTLSRVKAALHIDHTDDDGTLEVYITAASRLVLRHLKGQAGEVLGIDSPPDSPPNDLDTVPEEVVMATILLVGIFYQNPDGDPVDSFEGGLLPAPVRALLYHLRDPALA